MTTTRDLTIQGPPAAPARSRALWPVLVGVFVALIAAFVIIASLVKVPYDSLVPGDAQPVSRLIQLPSDQAHRLRGHILLTDVGVNTDLTLLGLIGAWFDSNATIVQNGQLTGGLPLSEFDAQGTVDMEESELTAEAVALRQLGYSVPETDVGVTIYVIDPGSPAWGTLQVGDVVTSIDGVATPNPRALQSVVRAHRPGEVVSLQVGSIARPTSTHNVSLRLGKLVDKNGTTLPLIGIGDPATAIAGMGTQPSYQLPFPVSINSDQIGGPSAGLAWTLGIIDSLSGGNLTAGHTIAATGTIHPDGTIGDVGGVKQKTVAVERAGATVFFVPRLEVPQARSKATPQLKVFGVSSLQEALVDLEKMGGDLGVAANGPPQGPGGHSVPFDWQDSPWT